MWGLMMDIDRIRGEYEKAVNKKQELTERLRQTEKTEPTNFNQIWIIRDQIAYWEGRSEGLKFALDELER
jgi:pyridoxine/pyridoxamine 5'-phosphate oxidase